MFAQEHLNLQLTRLEFPAGWSHKRDGLAFVFPKGGLGTYVSDDVVHRLASGDVVVLNGIESGNIFVPEGRALLFSTFSLCLEHMLPLFGCREIALLRQVEQAFRGARFYPASSALALECHRLIRKVAPQPVLDHRSQLLRIASAILTEEFKTVWGTHPGGARVENHLIKVIFDALSAKDLVNVSVSELASRFGCSRRHLSRLFHQYIGLSPAGLLMELRLAKAATLLRDPAAKVMSVASQCGFHHSGLFSTCFRRRFGCSPTDWRKRDLQREGTLAMGPIAADQECPLRSLACCPRSKEPARPVQNPPKRTEPETQLIHPVTADERSASTHPDAAERGLLAHATNHQ